MKKKIFFTGSTGILGCNWLEKFSNNYEILTLSYKNETFHHKYQNIILQNTSLEKLTRILKKFSPNLIIHTAALTNVDTCEKKSSIAFEANYTLTKKLVNFSKKLNIKFIYISSDHIFNGEQLQYSEIDSPSPINNYGLTKALSEKYIIKNLSNYLIIRTNFFGLGNYYKQSISEKIVNNLKLNIPIKLFDNIYFNPIDINILIRSIKYLIDKNLSGIFNISSNKKISKYEFGLLLAKNFNLNKSNIIKSKFTEKLKLTKRPLNMFIQNSKLKKINKNINFDINHSIKIFKKDYIKNYYKFRSIIPYGKHFLTNNDIQSVISVLRNKNLTQGQEVENFEKNIAEYVGAKYAIAVSSASAGLHLSFKALKKNKKTKLITSPITFVSSSNAALHSESEVKFIDINKETLNLDYKLIPKNKSKNSDILMPVHFAGAPCEMEQLSKIAKKNDFKIIEDAAHGLGGYYKDKSRIGNCKYSDATVFSLHPVKSITSGEGGIITTNNFNLYKKILRLRSHGINKLNDEMIEKNQAISSGIQNPWYYEMTAKGFNYRLTDIQSALGNSQLKSLETFIKKRRELVKRYDSKLKKIKNIYPVQRKFRDLSSHHLYVVKIDFKKMKTTRALFMNKLKQNGILTQVHYIPVPMHPYYKKLGYKMINLKNSKEYYDCALSLPLYYDLNFKQQDFVIENLIKFLK